MMLCAVLVTLVLYRAIWTTGGPDEATSSTGNTGRIVCSTGGLNEPMWSIGGPNEPMWSTGTSFLVSFRFTF